jgi:hypothetical protein
MGGGNLHDLLFESAEREAIQFRKAWEKSGGNRDSFRKLIRDVDPITFADRLRGRSVLMICAKEDKTVPPKCTIALWEAAGKPAITWYPCGHYTMARYFTQSLNQAVEFFHAWKKGRM